MRRKQLEARTMLATVAEAMTKKQRREVSADEMMAAAGMTWE